jgi:hypothetical protein
MALRRSGVRIPLGPLARAINEVSRSCAIICKTLKVTAGVVGRPVSEKGERGESPSLVSTGAHQTELACSLERETALVKVDQIANLIKVVSDGLIRYSKSKWYCKMNLAVQVGWYRGATSVLRPRVDEGFLFLIFTCPHPNPLPLGEGTISKGGTNEYESKL